MDLHFLCNRQISDYHQPINLNYKSLEYNQNRMIDNYVSNQLEKRKLHDLTDDGMYSIQYKIKLLINFVAYNYDTNVKFYSRFL